MNDSVAQKPSSNHPSWVWNLVVFMKLHTTLSWNAMSTFVRTCTPTLYCLEVPPCTQVLLTVCKRKLLPLPHPQWKSKSLLHQRGNTPYGSEDPSSLHCPHSNRCGSQNKNMMSLAHLLSIENAFKFLITFIIIIIHNNILITYIIYLNNIIIIISTKI